MTFYYVSFVTNKLPSYSPAKGITDFILGTTDKESMEVSSLRQNMRYLSEYMTFKYVKDSNSTLIISLESLNVFDSLL